VVGQPTRKCRSADIDCPYFQLNSHRDVPSVRAAGLLTSSGVKPSTDVRRNTAARNRLVMNHVSLVRAVACRLAYRLPSSVELSELIGVGTLALVDAAGRYRASVGVPFEAFARQRVHGAMLDSLRGLDWAPRSLRKKQRALDAAINRLRHELGREAEAGEIAAALDLTLPEYERTLEEVRAAELATIRLVGSGDREDSLLEVSVDAAENQYEQLERKELQRRLAVAVSRIPDRERQVLSLYYEQEMTLAEIGAAMNVSESRVSQLRTQAVARLRAALQQPTQTH
jgi:RNA polymerase sigma factor for flagellar operon FliA